jgi:hypothetical protein
MMIKVSFPYTERGIIRMMYSLIGGDEVWKVVKRHKPHPDLRKGQVLDSVSFPMMMREGENSKKMHTIQKYQATNKNSKG